MEEPMTGELTPEEQVAFDAKMQDRAFYRHTEVRLLKRYDLKLSRPLWDRWHHLVQHGAPEALRLGPSLALSGGDVWRVWFGIRVVYVCVRDGRVVTALPDNGQQYSWMVREAIRQREATSPERLARHARRDWERQAQEAANRRIAMAALPPPELRSRRNEAALAQLHGAGHAETSDD
jgi:hypothetical protein